MRTLLTATCFTLLLALDTTAETITVSNLQWTSLVTPELTPPVFITGASGLSFGFSTPTDENTSSTSRVLYGTWLSEPIEANVFPAGVYQTTFQLEYNYEADLRHPELRFRVRGEHGTYSAMTVITETYAGQGFPLTASILWYSDGATRHRFAFDGIWTDSGQSGWVLVDDVATTPVFVVPEPPSNSTLREVYITPQSTWSLDLVIEDLLYLYEREGYCDAQIVGDSILLFKPNLR